MQVYRNEKFDVKKEDAVDKDFTMTIALHVKCNTSDLVFFNKNVRVPTETSNPDLLWKQMIEDEFDSRAEEYGGEYMARYLHALVPKGKECSVISVDIDFV